ncbi:MAG TPA: proteinase inhibitor I4 serpin, partial [Cyanobacteria bacterium UBA11049]|nr:proteinase inhibitor I4 serpin [Cyanobacteria bacterium UBA11049]
MNYQDKTKTKFLQRRYATRLGRRYVSTAASVILLGFGGCSKLGSINSAVAQTPPLQQQTSPSNEQLATPVVNTKVTAANARFSFKLFSEILKQNNSQNSQNIFISPTSVAIALAMTYNGAKGETQQAMAKTLELQGISLQEINSANAALIAAVQNADDKVQLNIANSLWAKQDINFNPDFLQTNQDFYRATVTDLDFSDPSAVNAINDWVSQSTNGKIDRIVQQINPDDVMFLINAIYFKGKWTKEFDPEQTTLQPFYLTAGEEKQHPSMSQSGEYKYYENKKFQAVSLPYGNDGRLSLYVFLPSDRSSLTAFYQALNADNWEKWIAQFRNRQGSIRLPRFKINYDLTLNEALKALGMGVAFEPKADFSGIGDNLALSEVKHKTFVEVNEEGTEAAAATSVGIT